MFDCQAALASRIASRSQFQCVYRHGRDSTAATLLIAGTASARRFGSRNGRLWNIDSPTDQPQSALMLRARMSLPHFSVSSAMSLPKSVGEYASTSPPRSASRPFNLGSARPALISLLSLSTIPAGGFLRLPRPDQALPPLPRT